eukprot:3527919-Karenia_brevis.AAC.1
MAALQAVVAEQLRGDTLHHCCGLKRGMLDLEACSKRQSEVAKSILQWRWLIIDEVSMLSSQLLAEIDCKLRDVVRKLGTHSIMMMTTMTTMIIIATQPPLPWMISFWGGAPNATLVHKIDQQTS